MQRFYTPFRAAGLSLIILSCCCSSEPRLPASRFSAAQLQEDFHQLQTQITRRHAGYFIDRRELTAAFDRQSALIKDSMTLIEFYRLIAPALAQAKCGHTRLSLPESADRWLNDNGNYLPLEIIVIGDRLFMRRNLYDKPTILPGSAILSINGDPAHKILDRIKNCLPADGDNETYKNYQINNDFETLYLTFIDGPEEFVVTYRAPDDHREKTTRIPAQNRRTIRQYKIEHGLADKSESLISHSVSPDRRYAILKILFFDYDNLVDFAGIIDSVFKDLSVRRVRTLILDLRGNDGGDPYSSAYLLGYLIGKPFRYFAERSTFFHDDLKGLQEVPKYPFTGELYVLVDGGCYSTTGHFCSLLSYHQVGTFIGEETGGSYACNGGYRDVCLEHTGICFLLPHTTFITAVHGQTKGCGIMPDYPVQPSILDLVSGKDPVLEKARSLIYHSGS